MYYIHVFCLLGDGNCGIHALLDQLGYDQFWKEEFLTVADVRKDIVDSLDYMVESKRFEWLDDPFYEDEEDWKLKMHGNGYFIDQVFLQLASNFFHRKIVLHPVFIEDGVKFEFIPNPFTLENETATINMMFFSESRFIHGHYQSIVESPETVILDESPEVVNLDESPDNVNLDDSLEVLNTEELPETVSNEEQPENSVHNQAQNNSDATLSDLSGESNFEFSEDKLSWARLVSKAKCWNNTEIVGNKFTFGRSTTPELVNTESFPKLKKIISKEHFRIERKIMDGFKMTYVTDLSKRGTYINKKIIGLGNSYPILDGEFIGICGPATQFSYRFELIKKNDSATTESMSESEPIFDFESARNDNMDQNQSEKNEVPLPSKDFNDEQNTLPPKANEPMRQSRSRDKNPIFSPRTTRSKSNKKTKADTNSRSTRSTSNKRSHSENLSPSQTNKKAKVF